MKKLALVLAVFIALVIFCVAAIAAANQGLPNQFIFVYLDSMALYWNLLFSNPSIVFKLLAQKPVFIIQEIAIVGNNPALSSQIWGVYIMPLTVILMTALSAFIVYMKSRRVCLNIWLGLMGSSAILCASVLYVRVQSCCTENPSWIFDVMILSRVFNPLLNSDYWQNMYLAISPWFNVMQTTMMSISILLLYLCLRASEKK